MKKVIEFLKKWIVEIGFVAVSFLLMFIPAIPVAIKTFGFGLLFATIANPLIKYIIEINKN